MASDGGKLRIALAQINTTVGDIEGNAARIRDAIAAARAERAQIVVLVGYAEADGFVHNALGVLADGEVKASYTKMLLPNYGVFDERRYFEPGPSPALMDVNGRIVGLTICEDIWFPGPPAAAEALAGAGLILNASASPYHRGKGSMREHEIVAERAREVGAAVAICNAVGGQDELVFDGHSVVVDERGQTVARGAQFAEDLVVCDLELPPSGTDRRPDEVPGGMDAPTVTRLEVPEPEAPREAPPLPEPLPEEAEAYEALKLGLRDYVDKNGFEHVVLALSGGIDSALVALVAVDALGADRVTVVIMPSPHSSAETQSDARTMAANLGVELVEISIAEPM